MGSSTSSTNLPLDIPSSSQLFVQNFYPTHKAVIINSIEDKEDYQNHVSFYIAHLNNNTVNNTELNDDNDDDDNNNNNINTNSTLMKSNNIMANAYTKPVDIDKEQSYIEVSRVYLECLPKISMRTIMNQIKLYKQNKQNNSNNSDVWKGRSPSVQEIISIFLDETISNLADKKARIFKLLDKLVIYNHELLNQKMNEFHYKELEYLCSNNEEEEQKALQYRYSLTDIYKPKSHLSALEIQNGYDGYNFPHNSHSFFNWRLYTPELFEVLNKQIVNHQAGNHPFGYVGTNVKIIKSNHKHYQKYKDDTYIRYIRQGEQFYEIYCDYNNLRIIIIDNDYDPQSNYSLRAYKLLYWYYDTEKMQKVFGTFLFQWQNSEYIFSIINYDATNQKTTFIQHHSAKTLHDFIFFILPTFAKKLVKNNLYIVI
jgi:hypothetical protein